MDYKCTFQVSGKVLEIGETKTFASGFTKRTIIVEASKDAAKFSNPVCLTLKKDQTALADSLNVGDGVAAEGYVEGRRWEKSADDVRYFIDLSCKSIMVTDKAEKPTTAKNWKELLAVGAANGESEDAVKARCETYKARLPAGQKFAEADWQKLAAEIVAAHKTDGDPIEELNNESEVWEDAPF